MGIPILATQIFFPCYGHLDKLNIFSASSTNCCVSLYGISAMDVEILDINNSKWKTILDQFPHDIYHLPKYVSLEADRLKAQPEGILIQEQDSQFFLPYLLRNCSNLFRESLATEEIYDSVSPYGYPGILVNAAGVLNLGFGDRALQSLTEVFKQRQICSLFVRNHPILCSELANLLTPEALTYNGETVSIDLTLSDGELWSHTRRGHQSTINKCKRLGYTAKFVEPRDYLDKFMEIYYQTMSRVSAHPDYYFQKEYFDNLLKLDDYLHLGIVQQEEEIVALSLFWECDGIVQAHLGGTKTEFLKDSPFSLLLDAARYWAKERGNRYLHIGGGVGSNEDALYRFKSGFSKQRHKFWTLRLITNLTQYNHLVSLKEQERCEPLETNFFPAYRA